MPLNPHPKTKPSGNCSNGTVGTVQKNKNPPTGRSNGCLRHHSNGAPRAFQWFPSRSNGHFRAFQRFSLLPRNQLRSNGHNFLLQYRIDSIQAALERRLEGLQLSSLWLLQIQLSTRSKMAPKVTILTMHSPNQVHTKPQ